LSLSPAGQPTLTGVQNEDGPVFEFVEHADYMPVCAKVRVGKSWLFRQTKACLRSSYSWRSGPSGTIAILV
jgi:hypothetical protein